MGLGTRRRLASPHKFIVSLVRDKLITKIDYFQLLNGCYTFNSVSPHCALTSSPTHHFILSMGSKRLHLAQLNAYSQTKTTHTRTHTHTHTCTHAHTHTHTHTHTQTYTHKYTHTNTHTHRDTHTLVNVVSMQCGMASKHFDSVTAPLPK